ncbi:MAG: Phosphomethylpyrimidine synthase [Dehalococcoidia bacterium]|nr:Phosphomethylpyrimidine synthase [Chloroflexota bacterium]MBT9162508.1 Phosphomethylpyrimidine synthase [Chloroflexota bacterium]
MGARIAAHAGDIVKGIRGAREWDRQMSIARKNLDWDSQIKLALDPQKAAQVHARRPTGGGGCSMCGSYCAMELVSEYLGSPKKEC